MSTVPERDIVDRCFAAARGHLDEAKLHTVDGAPAMEVVVLECSAAVVSALEGLMHQVRDADDTIATTLVPMLENQLSDLTTKVDMTSG